MTAHVWDGGLARGTHQEFDGIGGDNRFTIGDNSTTLNFHASHVTGTIIASGFVASAKGMAPQALGVGYDWNSDESEVTLAASNGMLVSIIRMVLILAPYQILGLEHIYLMLETWTL